MARRLVLLMVLSSAAVLVLLPAAAAGGGCHAPGDLQMSSSDSTTVAIGKCAFRDTVVYVEPGQEITWVNKDPVPHSVSGAAGSWGTEELLQQGDRISYSFDKAGVYPYYCVLHPTMVGAVVVGDGGSPGVVGLGATAVQKADPLEQGSETVASSVQDDDGGNAPLVAGAVIIGLLGAGWFGLRRPARRATIGA